MTYFNTLVVSYVLAKTRDLTFITGLFTNFEYSILLLFVDNSSADSKYSGGALTSFADFSPFH